MADEQEVLYTNGVFEYQKRPRRDVGWSVAYVIFTVATVVLGVYAINQSSPELHSRLSDASFRRDPRNCPYDRHKNLLEAADGGNIDVPDFFRHAVLWLVVTSVGSLVLGMTFLLLFKHVPRTMVWATIYVQVALPVVLGLAAAASGQLYWGLILLGIGLLAGFTYYLWRNEIELCARLLGVSAIGLNSNPGLIFFCFLLKIALTLFMLPSLVFVLLAQSNGKIVPNAAREGRSQCSDAQGQAIDCCVWETYLWVKFYYALTTVTLLWTIFTVGQLRVYVMSGAIAQWYFAPPNSPAATRGTTMRSVRHALGPSFGTLSFGAAIMTFVSLARNATQTARANARGSAELVWSLLSFFLECIYSLIEYLTKFATVMAAITGEAFLDAGRRSSDLLRRNFLKSYAVWFFPPMVMHLAALSLSIVWGMVVFLLYWVAAHNKRPYGTQEASLFGVISFFVAWVVLSFFASILLNIVDAVYLCYAIDKDNQTVTHAEVHEIYGQVPVGAAVEQPDGSLEYGAPQPRSPPATYVPPNDPAAAQNFRDSATRV